MTNKDTRLVRRAALAAVALLLAALACNLPTQTQPTQALFASTRTPISTNTLGPSSTWIYASATSPSAPQTPMPGSTATPGPTPTYPVGFAEGFDFPLDNWLDWFTLTTRTPGGGLRSSFSQRNGVLTIGLNDEETYLYRFYEIPQPADSYVEAEFSIEGQKENAFSLVCRAAEDHSVWYEARISGNGAYQIYRYSLARKTQEGLNPFINLASGYADPDTYNRGGMNVVRLTCQGSTLRLSFRGGQQVIQLDDALNPAGSLNGFGVIGYSNFPTTIQIDEVNSGPP